MKHTPNPDLGLVTSCIVCGADMTSSLTGGGPCTGSPLVDVYDENDVLTHRSVALSECLPEADDYADALPAIAGDSGIYQGGGGAAPAFTLRRASTFPVSA